MMLSAIAAVSEAFEEVGYALLVVLVVSNNPEVAAFMLLSFGLAIASMVPRWMVRE